MTQTIKNLPAIWETRVCSLGQEDPLEKGMATHSSILAWENPRDRGAWWATVHGVTESWTRPSDAVTCQALDGAAELSPSAGERGQQKGSDDAVETPEACSGRPPQNQGSRKAVEGLGVCPRGPGKQGKPRQ